MTTDPPTPVLLLIGLRGSGKSTLGRALGQQRGVGFLDLDDAVLRAMGHATVADAWRAEGEGAFRMAETQALRRTLESDAPGRPRVIALGGGTPTAPGAADLIREARRAGVAMVVYLRCAPDELRRRLRILGVETGDSNRPSLTGKSALDEVEDVFNARDPLYRELADHTFENIASVDEGLAAIEPVW